MRNVEEKDSLTLFRERLIEVINQLCPNPDPAQQTYVDIALTLAQNATDEEFIHAMMSVLVRNGAVPQVQVAKRSVAA